MPRTFDILSIRWLNRVPNTNVICTAELHLSFEKERKLQFDASHAPMLPKILRPRRSIGASLAPMLWVWEKVRACLDNDITLTI